MATTAPSHSKESTLAPRRLGALLVAAVTFVAYIGTLWFPFVFDDWLLIAGNPRVQAWRWVPKYFTADLWAGMPSTPADYYRPLFLLWLRLNHAAFGLHPFGWHLTTVLVYVGAAVMIYALALRLTQRTWIAVFTGMAFALHPSHVETGAWICDSLDSLALIMFTGAFVCWLRYREKKSRAGLALSLLLYAAAMLTKEPAIVLPAIIAAYVWIWDGRERSPLTRAWRALRPALVFMPLSVAYLLVRVWALKGFSHPVEHPSLAQVLLTLPSVLFFYLRMLFWPAGLSAFYDTGYVDRPELHQFVIPLIGTALFCAAAWYVVHKLPENKPAKFGLAWLLFTLLPALYLPAFSASELVHDRYLYMASAGFFLFLGTAIAQAIIGAGTLLESPRLRAGVLLVVIAGLLCATIIQQTYWSSDLLLYARGTKIAPNNGLPAMDLAAELVKRGQYDKAYPLLENLVRRLPTNPAVNYDFGLLQYRLHEYPRAEFYLARAAAYDSSVPEAHLMLGIVLTRLGKPDLGAEEIRKSIELVPEGKGLHGALSEALEAQQDFSGALREAQIEAQRSPEDQALQNRIARLKAALAHNQTAPRR